jgi:hypothetical protein
MRLVLLAITALAAGCATPQSRFTRPDELDALAREPLPEPPHAMPLRDVETWTLDGELPVSVVHVPLAQAEGPLGALLAKASFDHGVVPSADLMCIAAQTARFELANEGTPGTLLQRFIETRCGSPSARVVLSSLFGDAAESHPDAELVEHWGADIEKHLSSVPKGAYVGLAMVRANGKARITLAWAFDEVQLDPISIFPDGDAVRIRGVVGHDVDDLFGSVNQGDFGSADCVKNTAVALPQFELACPVLPGDASAWVGVWVRDHGRFLGHTVFEALVWPKRAPSATYTRPTHALLRDASAAAFLEALNGLRAQQGRGPLSLAARQSEQVATLVPPYLAASRAQDAAKADRIALGLIAGWRVEQPVTQGLFTSSRVPAGSAKELLALMLEQPGGRRQLLSKDARVLAFGTAETAGVLDALVCTYSVVEEAELSTDRVRAVLEKLNAARTKRGLPAAQWVQLPAPVAPTATEDLRKGKAAPKEALERMMQETSQLVHKPVHGFVLRTPSLDELTWPEDLLTGNPQVMLMLASWKDPELPWTSYCVMVVSFEGSTATQA